MTKTCKIDGHFISGDWEFTIKSKSKTNAMISIEPGAAYMLLWRNPYYRRGMEMKFVIKDKDLGVKIKGTCVIDVLKNRLEVKDWKCSRKS